MTKKTMILLSVFLGTGSVLMLVFLVFSMTKANPDCVVSDSLTVTGDINAGDAAGDKVKAWQYCDENGNNCHDASEGWGNIKCRNLSAVAGCEDVCCDYSTLVMPLPCNTCSNFPVVGVPVPNAASSLASIAQGAGQGDGIVSHYGTDFGHGCCNQGRLLVAYDYNCGGVNNGTSELFAASSSGTNVWNTSQIHADTHCALPTVLSNVKISRWSCIFTCPLCCP